ncbi:GNAT family N-acetyltransferase [Amycolatopsis nigrescens]|uniref:GNAT family N-acetyltransferase n=1 Tax=Amycolatopsis nigrescens TaxID=381445 RepID=UPI000476700C
MSDFRIVPAGTHQAGALTALMEASAAYQGRYASILAGYQVTAADIEQYPTFVAMADAEILGFYSLIVEPPELDLLFVADKAQGTGLGAELVAHMFETAREKGISSVRVVSHPPAEGFYLRMGARRIGVIPAKPPKIPWERPELVFDVPA